MKSQFFISHLDHMAVRCTVRFLGVTPLADCTLTHKPEITVVGSVMILLLLVDIYQLTPEKDSRYGKIGR